jgi:hypothetical protein
MMVGFDSSTIRIIGFDSSAIIGFDISAIIGFDISMIIGFDISAIIGFDISMISGFDISAISGFEIVTGNLDFNLVRINLVLRLRSAIILDDLLLDHSPEITD